MTVLDADHHHPSQLPQPRESFGDKLVWFISSPWRVVLIAAAAVLAVDAGGTDEGAGVCVFRRCTGGYCPGCGLTRSARHLTRGEVGAAWRDHPWMVLLVVQAVVGGAAYAVVRRMTTSIRWVRVMVAVAIGNGVVLLGIWVTRLVDGSIPRFW